LYAGFYGIAALTLVRSAFEDKNGELVSSSWDSRIITSVTAGKRFGENWEVGMQYQLIGGTPYTPYNEEQTALIVNWDNIGFGIPDYNRLNEQRLANFNRLNVRVTRRWYMERVNLDLYFDVQNALAQKIEGQPFIDVQRDATGAPIVNPDKPDSYLITNLPNQQGTVLPSIGIIVVF
jgi:hypothetical protein